MRFLFALFLLLGLTSNAEAASLYMDPSTATLNRGDAVTISVRLDTDEAAGECVNAIDGIITYDPSITPVDISVGKSIFPIWVEAPVINKEKHTITFAGGIPNGYCGRIAGDPRLTNSLVKLIFRSPGFSIGGGSGSSTATVAFTPETTAAPPRFDSNRNEVDSKPFDDEEEMTVITQSNDDNMPPFCKVSTYRTFSV